MAHPIHRAQPPLEFIPQKFNPFVYFVIRGLLPILLLLRLRPWLPTAIAKIETVNVELLVDLYRKFQDGKIRFLMAFRHCEVDDPLCMLHLLAYAVPKVARKKGISLQYPTHSHFLYDRGMLLWAGEWLGWLFSRVGGLPIFRGKVDRVSLRTARDLFASGKYPISVAPEGATNGHSEIISDLEPGVAQLSFWCVEKLIKEHRDEEVLILPIGLQYRYINPRWKKLDCLLSKLEADSGLEVKRIDPFTVVNREKIFYERLFHLGEYVLSEIEKFYDRFYHQHPRHQPATLNHDSSANPNELLATRLEILLNRSLQAAEQYFGLEPKGTIIERCRRIESVGWNDIYRGDLDLQTLSPMQRGLADWIAEEASLRMLHMRLVESFVAVTGTYVQQKLSFERFAETSLILFDLIERIKGEKNPRRPRMGWRQARLTVGEPISVTQRWSSYHENRHAAKQAVNDLTRDLQISLENLIV